MEDIHVMPGQNCPYCDKHVDRASNAGPEGSNPEEGDFCVCIYCGEVGRFDADIKLQKTTPEDLAELQREAPDSMQQLQEVSSTIKSARKNLAEITGY